MDLSGEVLAGDGWRLRAWVPDGIFTLAVEADDAAARAEHEAFADRCLPLLVAGGEADQPLKTRAALIEQLGTLRAAVAESGIGYLGVLVVEHESRPSFILLALAAARHHFPDPVDPASLLAAMLRHQYPQAAVEELPVAHGTGVGVRRAERLILPQPTAPAGRALTIDAGISQAFVPFPSADLLGTVSGFTANAEDIDLATVFTATIACRMTIIADGD